MSGILMASSMAGSVGGSSFTYATWNPSDKATGIVLSNGNLSAGASAAGSVRGTQGKSSGKWFFEVYVANAYGGMGIGIANFSSDLSGAPTTSSTGTNSVALYKNGSVLVGNSTILATTGGFSSGQTIGIAFDATDRTIRFFNNAGSLLYTVTSANCPAGALYPLIGFTDAAATPSVGNFGASTFTRTVPSGYNAGVYE